MADIKDFQKLTIKVGTIKSAEKVKGSTKMLKLEIDLGHDQRIILAAIGEHYSPNNLKGKQVPILANLEPKELMGIESQGMILSVDVEGEPILIHPDKKVVNGSKIR